MRCAARLGAIALPFLGAGCEVEAPALAAGGDPAAGRRLIAAYDCGVCHRIPGVPGAKGVVGPPLRGFGAHVYIAGRFENTAPMLARWILDPPALKPSTAMPAVGVDETEARDIAAYLLSLR